MAKNSNHTDVPLKYPIPAEGDEKAVITSLEVSRPKTRHLFTLTTIVGPDLAQFIASADGDDAKQKLAALAENTDIGALITSLVKPKKLKAFLALLADLCGITAGQAGEIDLVDQVTIFEALFDFFPALKSLAKEEGDNEDKGNSSS